MCYFSVTYIAKQVSFVHLKFVSLGSKLMCEVGRSTLPAQMHVIRLKVKTMCYLDLISACKHLTVTGRSKSLAQYTSNFHKHFVYWRENAYWTVTMLASTAESTCSSSRMVATEASLSVSAMGSE